MTPSVHCLRQSHCRDNFSSRRSRLLDLTSLSSTSRGAVFIRDSVHATTRSLLGVGRRSWRSGDGDGLSHGDRRCALSTVSSASATGGSRVREDLISVARGTSVGL